MGLSLIKPYDKTEMVRKFYHMEIPLFPFEVRDLVLSYIFHTETTLADLFEDGVEWIQLAVFQQKGLALRLRCFAVDDLLIVCVLSARSCRFKRSLPPYDEWKQFQTKCWFVSYAQLSYDRNTNVSQQWIVETSKMENCPVRQTVLGLADVINDSPSLTALLSQPDLRRKDISGLVRFWLHKRVVVDKQHYEQCVETLRELRKSLRLRWITGTSLLFNV
jgi:hypothetical protein